MKTVILGLFLVSSSAFAAPWALRGDYRPSGASAIGRLTVDVVDTRFTDAQERLDRLSAAGARCSWANSHTARCTTPSSEVPAGSVTRAIEKMKGLALSFGEITAPAELVSQGTDVTEWTVHQNGRWNGGEFTEYRYIETAGLAKIVLPGAAGPLWLNTRDGKTLGVYTRVVVNESRWRWHEDAVSVELTQ